MKGKEEEISLFPFGEFPVTKKAHIYFSLRKEYTQKRKTLLSFIKILVGKHNFLSFSMLGKPPLLLSNPTPPPPLFPPFRPRPAVGNGSVPPSSIPLASTLSQCQTNKGEEEEGRTIVLASCVKTRAATERRSDVRFFCSTFMWGQVFSQFYLMRRKNDCAETEDIIIV